LIHKEFSFRFSLVGQSGGSSSIAYLPLFLHHLLQSLKLGKLPINICHHLDIGQQLPCSLGRNDSRTRLWRSEARLTSGESDVGRGKILWRRAWQPTPVFLAGEFHGQRSLEGYCP